MFSGTMLGWFLLSTMILGITFYIIFFYWPATKAKRKQEAENSYLMNKIAQATMLAEGERKERRLKNLQQQKFYVYIRKSDGRRTCFETNLIGEFLKYGITVKLTDEATGALLAANNTAPLKDGTLGLVGVFITRTDSELLACDFRVLAADESGEGKIVAVGVERSFGERALAEKMIYNISMMLPLPLASATS